MQTITIGGKTFDVVQEGSIRFELHVEATLRRYGLQRIEIQKGESPDAFATRLFDEIISTGACLEIVSLFLTPSGVPWSVPQVAKTAEFLADLTDPVDKAKVRDLVVQAFMGFFKSGLALLVISRTSLGRAGEIA